MDQPQAPQPAFIPRQSFRTHPTFQRNRTVNLFFLSGVSIFALAVIASAAIFIYHRILLGKVDGLSAKLEKAQVDLNPPLVGELISFDQRLRKAREIFDKHSIVTPIFDFLEEKTSINVRYRGLDMNRAADGSVSLTLDGEARSYGSVAFQADTFATSDFLGRVEISDIAPSERGLVSFKVKAAIDPNRLLYYEPPSPSAEGSGEIVEELPAEGGAE